MAENLPFAHDMRRRWLTFLPEEHLVTLDVLNACPAENILFRPHQRSLPFAVTALHLYRTGPWILALVRGLEPGPNEIREDETPTKEELLAECERLFGEFIRALRDVSLQRLASTVNIDGLGEFSAIDLVDWHIRHWIHHRGQLQLCLRLMGAQCPVVYGASADFPITPEGEAERG